MRHVERSKIVWRWDTDSEERWVEEEEEEEEDMVVVIWKNDYGHYPMIISNDDHRQLI